MSVYVCEEHKVAFPREAQAKAHWNFQHEKGDTWLNVDRDAIVQEEVPEGYVFRETPARSTATPQPGAGTAQPTTPVAEKLNLKDDPEAERLEHMLKAIGVPDIETTRIVNGFVNIPQIRNDANYLSHWLDTHIRADKALKAYIPMIVGEVIGQGGGIVVPLGTPSDGMGPRFPFSPYPGFTPGGYYPQPQYYPPPTAQKDPEVMELIKGLNQRFEGLLSMIQADREERTREQKEREQKEREQQTNAKIDKIQETVLEFIKGQGSSDKSETGKHLEALMTEIKDLRTDQQTKAFEAVLGEVTALRQSVATTKSEVVGRSTEDLVHDIGPLALDKVDKMGERIQNELKGLREQMGPSLKEKIDEAAKTPRSLEIIEDQVNTENEIARLTDSVEVVVEGEQPTEASPAVVEEQPYARMPDPTRRRRARRGDEESDKVSGTPPPAIAP